MVRSLLLDGVKSVIDRLEMFAGVPITRDQVYRWSMRENDPLPLEQIGNMGRPRIVAEPMKIEQWARRNLERRPLRGDGNEGPKAPPEKGETQSDGSNPHHSRHSKLHR